MIWAVLVPALLAGRQFPPGPLKRPWLTFMIFALLAVALAAQMMSPDLLPRFQREARAVADGQVYRLFTALWFQDGWLAGGIFNLTLLIFVGFTAEQIWRRAAWIGLYLGVALAVEYLALSWQPIGAGNSIAVFALAGSLLGANRDRKFPILALRAIGALAAVLLAWQHDIHGAAAVAGLLLGMLLRGTRAARNQSI